MQCLQFVSFALTEGWLTMISFLLYWIVAGTVVAVILRAIESFYIDEAMYLALDVLFWPIAVFKHFKEKRGY